MNPPFLRPGLCLLALASVATAAPTYPVAKKGTVTDEYHGTKVEDPYRWLEDDNSAETKAWTKAENKVTRAWLAAIPQRETIRKRLKTLWNYERVGMPFENGGKWFTYRNSGLQQQAILYVGDSPEAEGKVLLDPNKLSKDSSISIANEAASEDGKMLGYSLSSSGSDWEEIRVRDVATGKDLPDVIKWVKFSSISWRYDNSGFYYSRYDAPKKGGELSEKNEFHKLYFHKIGTKQDADVLVYERKDHPNWYIGAEVSEDGRYLVITTNEGTDTDSKVFFKDLSVADSPVAELVGKIPAYYGYCINEGPVFYFQTDQDAPRGRVIAVDSRTPEKDKWREIVPQSKDALEGAGTPGGKLVCRYLQDAKSVIKCYELDGTFIRDIALPGIGSVANFDSLKKTKEPFYAFSGYTYPTTIFRLNLATGESKLWRKPKIGFKDEDYETTQVFAPSKDGTKVPMFIVHKKGLKLDGSNPTLLYGYGGFAMNETPYFSVARAVWMEMGGVLAVANIRGGGEYGKEWHEASIKTKKQNGFDDFIGAAEWLIANKYTSSPKLAIQGGSNGGLLIGACMTQRPELFGATLPEVGVMDMLRFHKFTIGWGWIPEYGSSDNAEEFKVLAGYSPYHNLKPGIRYPATLITTADHDDRVVPAHSFKFAARLQEYQPKDGPPVLIRIESSSGHSGSAGLDQQIDTNADEWAFLVKVFGMTVK